MKYFISYIYQNNNYKGSIGVGNMIYYDKIKDKKDILSITSDIENDLNIKKVTILHINKL